MFTHGSLWGLNLPWGRLQSGPRPGGAGYLWRFGLNRLCRPPQVGVGQQVPPWNGEGNGNSYLSKKKMNLWVTQGEDRICDDYKPLRLYKCTIKNKIVVLLFYFYLILDYCHKPSTRKRHRLRRKFLQDIIPSRHPCDDRHLWQGGGTRGFGRSSVSGPTRALRVPSELGCLWSPFGLK